MFSAIIIFKNRIYPEFKDQVITYLPNSQYAVVIVSNGDIDNYKKIQLGGNIQTPMNAYQKYDESIERAAEPTTEYLVQDGNFQILTSEETEKRLISIRSGVQYWINEKLSPDDFYVTLITEDNENLTRRTYKYQLMYSNMQCYELNDEVTEEMNDAIRIDRGTLVVSSYTLNIPHYPKWIIRELMRDMIEMGEIDMEGKEMVEGEVTGEIYLFHKNGLEPTDDELLRIGKDLTDRIKTSLELKIFPRRTPREMVLSKRLVTTNGNQYTIPYKVDADIKIYDEILKQIILFDNMGQLFNFLMILMTYGTYVFMERELKIYVMDGSSAVVIQETKYLPDFIKVRIAGRVKSAGTVQLIYPTDKDPDDLDKYYAGQQQITFYDSESGRMGVLLRPAASTQPVMEMVLPKDYSLKSRISYDK